MVSGHCQSLQLTGLGKSLPLIRQQQPRLNYKRRVYSAHTKGTPQVPSLGGSGGCATGPYRTATILAHTTKTKSKQLYLVHRNTNREAAKMRNQRNMAQMKEQINTPEEELNKMEISKSIRCRVQNTDYKDSQGT